MPIALQLLKQARGLPIALQLLKQARGLPIALQLLKQARGLPIALQLLKQARGLPIALQLLKQARGLPIALQLLKQARWPLVRRMPGSPEGEAPRPGAKGHAAWQTVEKNWLRIRAPCGTRDPLGITSFQRAPRSAGQSRSHSHPVSARTMAGACLPKRGMDP
ncbi:hypothetical protein SIID45300_03153 [Candidatus Magnetaquicoccaceae bacterium FCR-1]|uniref:Uncharacterized protein n=1 Tax=Candidatus Magnetaquiglobus chichijimensis TaxID=3141448 RepID=A0ABQ0CD20_9PROT